MAVQTSYADSVDTGFSGQLADDGEHDIIAMTNDEVSAEIAFGRAVKFNSTSVATSAALPSDESSIIAGIVVHSHRYLPTTELGTTGLKPGVILNVLRKGRIKVTVEDAVQVGDRLWVRGVAGGDPEFLGGLLPADDGTDTVDCTNQGVFLTEASAGALAVLEVDFTNRPT